MHVDPQVAAEIRAAVDAACDVVRRRRPWFQTPAVEFFRRRRTAGTALAGRLVSINLDFWEQHRAEMVRQVIPHEVAHIAVHQQWQRVGGPRPRPHGGEWQRVMHLDFGLRPDVTHDMYTGDMGIRRQQRHAYACACKVHHVSTVRHNKMARGKSYLCVACKTRLVAGTTLQTRATKEVAARSLVPTDLDRRLNEIFGRRHAG